MKIDIEKFCSPYVGYGKNHRMPQPLNVPFNWRTWTIATDGCIIVLTKKRPEYKPAEELVFRKSLARIYDAADFKGNRVYITDFPPRPGDVRCVDCEERANEDTRKQGKAFTPYRDCELCNGAGTVKDSKPFFEVSGLRYSSHYFWMVNDYLGGAQFLEPKTAKYSECAPMPFLFDGGRGYLSNIIKRSKR